MSKHETVKKLILEYLKKKDGVQPAMMDAAYLQELDTQSAELTKVLEPYIKE